MLFTDEKTNQSLLQSKSIDHEQDSLAERRRFLKTKFKCGSVIVLLTLGFIAVSTLYVMLLLEHNKIVQDNNDCQRWKVDTINRQKEDYQIKKIDLSSTGLSVYQMVMADSASDFPTATNPILQSLNLSNTKLQRFSSNQLPQLTSLDLSNNPNSLAVSINFNSLKNMVQLNIDNTLINNFRNNSFQLIKSLKINHQINLPIVVNFDSNYLPAVETLQYGPNIQINQFCDNNIANITTLKFIPIPTNPSFDRNNFTKLESLWMQSPPIKGGLSTIGTKNVFPNLKQVIIEYQSLYNLNEFMTSMMKNLERVKLISNSISQVSYFTHTNIKQLHIQDDIFLKNFTLNALPNLQKLSFDGCLNLSDISGSQLTKVTMLNISNTNIQEIKNHFPSLTTIEAANTSFFNCTDMPELVLMNISQSKISKFSNISHRKLEQLLIYSPSKLTAFTNNSFASLKKLSITNSAITNFDCNGFPSLQILNLSQNRLLVDSLIQTLISCKFAVIKQFYLIHCGFINSQRSKDELQEAYPNAKVYIT